MLGYQTSSGAGWGVQSGTGVVDSSRLGADVPASLQAFIERCAQNPGLARQAAAGVGYARTPPVWIKVGDTIEIEIEGIGVLSNPVTA